MIQEKRFNQVRILFFRMLLTINDNGIADSEFTIVKDLRVKAASVNQAG